MALPARAVTQTQESPARQAPWSDNAQHYRCPGAAVASSGTYMSSVAADRSLFC
jgi:hypothetical protein